MGRLTVMSLGQLFGTNKRRDRMPGSGSLPLIHACDQIHSSTEAR